MIGLICFRPNTTSIYAGALPPGLVFFRAPNLGLTELGLFGHARELYKLMRIGWIAYERRAD